MLLLNQAAPQGEVVKEDKPCRFKYQHLCPRSKAPLSKINVDIYEYEDPHNVGAPQYRDDNSKFTDCLLPPSRKYVTDGCITIDGVTKLATIPADLSRIPTYKFPTETGTDGKVWYVIDYEIRITYLSAYTKYELFYKRTNLGEVMAEYV